jgi:hypothetical protein
MKFTVDKAATLEDLSKELTGKGIVHTLDDKGVLKVDAYGESYVITVDDAHFDVCKPASGIACLILASIPAAICYVIGKFAFEAGGFLLSMTAFIPFIIFQMIFQRALTVQGGENIENLVKQIQGKK